MPNLQNIAAWVADLESGEHRQAQRFLHVRESVDREGNKIPESFCCLGRACVLAVEAGVEMPVREVDVNGQPVTGYGDYWTESTVDNTPYYEPVQVDEWLGISREELREYATMNDDGHTFAEIAARIRRHWLGG